MEDYTVAVLVRNQYGVLNRVTSMLRRRQLNIGSLTVSETESPEYSRITIRSCSETLARRQLLEQLDKLPDVCFIEEMDEETSVSWESMLIKMENGPQVRETAEAMGAATLDQRENTVIFSLAGDTRQLNQFVDRMKPYTILEMCRTGAVSLRKGSSTIRKAEVSA